MKSLVRWVIVGLLAILIVEFPRELWTEPQGGLVTISPTHRYPPFHGVLWLTNLSDFFHRLFTLSFGTSQYEGGQIVQDVMKSFESTVVLIFFGLLFVMVLGVPKGIFDGLRNDSKTVNSFTSNFLQWVIESIPDIFFIFSLEMFGFYLNRHGIQVYFVGSNQFGPGTILPALLLALVPAMYMARVVRSVIEEQFGQQYIVTARAKGLSPRRVLFRHLVPNTLPIIIQAFIPVLGMLLANLVLIEFLFYRPGVVSSMLNAMDYGFFIPGDHHTPDVYSSRFDVFGFDPTHILVLLFSCVVLFLLCVLFVRLVLWGLRYNSPTQMNPYSDILRDASGRYVPWQLIFGFGVFGVLIALGILHSRLPIPGPDQRFVLTIHDDRSLATPPYPPSGAHLLGTDSAGRDLLSRTIGGILPTFFCVGGVAAATVVTATSLALMAGVWKIPGMRFIVKVWGSLFTFIPSVIGALLILEIPVVYWGGPATSIKHLLLVLIALFTVEAGRVASNILSRVDDLEGKSYMEAAEISGNSKWSRLLIHHARALIFFIAEQFVVEFGRVLLLMVTLGFFGIAVSMQWQNWNGSYFLNDIYHDWGGIMVENARDYLGVPWVLFAPILFMTITIFASNLVLSGIRKMTQVQKHNPSSGFTMMRLVAFTTRQYSNIAVEHANTRVPQA